ncbi:uncharacterized protein B0H18DRAFT_950532 [Fomitopsis serialis]|uniref:uncharacterized protein n=1 Tax=Fomitopsis serialis TaxID=139415 RepID=UPI00200834B4|nr:uncharacterized protein B0H18DRAFT_950532 [Neoantrodia serialis]KAH9936144.1 hypothetical protein B0H18DRAFT_950532 [Neoantrodia serialis]
MAQAADWNELEEQTKGIKDWIEDFKKQFPLDDVMASFHRMTIDPDVPGPLFGKPAPVFEYEEKNYFAKATVNIENLRGSKFKLTRHPHQLSLARISPPVSERMFTLTSAQRDEAMQYKNNMLAEFGIDPIMSSRTPTREVVEPTYEAQLRTKDMFIGMCPP